MSGEYVASVHNKSRISRTKNWKQDNFRTCI